MTFAEGSRAFIFLFTILHLSYAQNGSPTVQLQALRPRGFRAYIEDNPRVTLFVFQGNVNRPIGSNDLGSLSGEVLQATNGRWMYENRNIELKVGDVINYYYFLSFDRIGYLKDNLTFTVTELEELEVTPPDPSVCEKTVTRVRGVTVCAGQTIFEDNFDKLREDIWQIEQYIPLNHQEFPFNSYQRLAQDPTVSVQDGSLRITPKLQQNVPGFNRESISTGSLNLFTGCTAVAEACYRQASGPDILYPVVSGRISSKQFAFTYGTVHVRAKLPQGDWLYPEILLEPFTMKYGSSRFASGVLKIATARGNKELSQGTEQHGNQVLYGGPVMDADCRNNLIKNNVLNDGSQWGDNFHTYSLRWEPERIILSVDQKEWARIEPAVSGLRGWFPDHCIHLPRTLLGFGSKLAPFDDHFYITLGVATGGITEFSDGLVSRGRSKPWNNHARKAMFMFWQDLSNWISSWTQPQLVVDYVRVVAL